MNKFKNKLMSVALSAAMVASMFAPMGAQAATITSDYITTSNGLNVKLTAMIDGDNAAYAADWGGNQSSTEGNIADVFDGNENTGVIFRSDSTSWDGYIQYGDYIQVGFEEAIDFNGIDFSFWTPPEENGASFDGFRDATLEYTTDGEKWEVLETFTGVVRSFEYDADATIPGVEAIRLVNKLNERFRVWIRLADIAVDGAVAEAPAKAEYDIEVTERVDEMVQGMSLRDKVTQMLMVDFRKWGETAGSATDFTVMNEQVQKIVEDYNFGSVISLQTTLKKQNSHTTFLQQCRKLLQKMAALHYSSQQTRKVVLYIV